MGSSRPAARPARAVKATNRLGKRTANDNGSVLLDGTGGQGTQKAPGLVQVQAPGAAVGAQDGGCHTGALGQVRSPHQHHAPTVDLRSGSKVNTIFLTPAVSEGPKGR